MAHVAPWKYEEVSRLVSLLKEYPVVGVAKVEGIPSAQMQTIRKTLRSDASIKISKNTLLRIALREAAKERPGLEGLEEYMDGSTALVGTRLNPFKLFKRLESSKTRAPARGGEIAPHDVVVPKGETPFKPGPIVGELQKAGVPAKIEGGKVVIAQDKVLVRAGEVIRPEVAQTLTRLEIFPLVVGVELEAVYENGTVFRREVLSVDEGAILADLKRAAQSSFSVALEIGWTTPLTIEALLVKAHRQALSLAVHAAIPEKGALEALLGRALREAVALSRLSPLLRDEKIEELLRSSSPPPPPPPTSSPEKETKEEKPTEEEAMAGLGALFG